MEKKECTSYLLPVRDTMEIIGGKWKIAIILYLSHGNRRFKEMEREIGITGKMLSKELKELEINELVKRTVYDTSPVTIEYSITPYGKTLEKLLNEIRDWGVKHRKRIITKSKVLQPAE